MTWNDVALVTGAGAGAGAGAGDLLRNGSDGVKLHS